VVSIVLTRTRAHFDTAKDVSLRTLKAGKPSANAKRSAAIKDLDEEGDYRERLPGEIAQMNSTSSVLPGLVKK
jgi:hypothetical protein